MKININNKIVSIGDVHIRFGSRHAEFDIVFKRLIKDVASIKPRRIVLTGDLFHLKINLSPIAVKLAGELLSGLSKIAPVDIILGNHDLNMKSLSQGNAISPIIELLHNGQILTKENHVLKDFKNEHGVYFYLDSGFYNVDEKIIYGVYSCWDEQILTLNKKDKEKDKTYIALFHGAVYGSRANNGMEMKSDTMIKKTTFSNFDVVMMGDIHEHQSFELDGKERMAYQGSLLQNDFSESLKKGYLVYDIQDCSFDFRHIPNDYGYSKLNISKGEIVEDRLLDLQFSLDKRKTKVRIEIEDDEENYSVERERQIAKFVKDRHGCEIVDVDFKPISKNNIDENSHSVDENEIDAKSSDDVEKLLFEFLTQRGYDGDFQEVIDLHKEIDSKLKIGKEIYGKKWDIETIETSNFLSQPLEITKFDFNKLDGLVGIFGENYSGKSNIIRALVWLFWGEMLGGGEPYALVNLYTGCDKAWVRGYINVGGQRRCVYRSATVSYKKDGKPAISYEVEYKYEIITKDENGKEISTWEDVPSEDKALQKTEVKNVIIQTLGTFDDFTKVALQSQGGDDNYLSMKQQPKNDLISKFLGLNPFRDRFILGNEEFKEIKKNQKNLGDPTEIEKSIEKDNEEILILQKELLKFEEEKNDTNKTIDEINSAILFLTRDIIKLTNISDDNEEVINEKIKSLSNKKEIKLANIEELTIWLSNNYKKELPKDIDENTSKSSLESRLNSEQLSFNNNKENWKKLDEWIKSNSKKEELDTAKTEKEVDIFKEALLKLQNQLKLAKGEKCPTCEHVTHEANPEIEKKCKVDIARGESKLLEKKKFIEEQKTIVKNNLFYDTQFNKEQSLKNTLVSQKESISKLTKNIADVSVLNDIIAHNNLVESKSKSSELLKNEIQKINEDIDVCNKNLIILKENIENIEKNKTLNEKISLKEQEVKDYKMVLYQLDNKLKNLNTDVKMKEHTIQELKTRLESIREADRVYKKYSIYIQAVDRDGIPAKIIQKKLPVINYKINSIIKNLVNFKIELYIKSDGDIKEMFYYNSEKKDKLPLSMASGAQKFIASIAITDAFHYVSCLTKPSLRIIDEGFGTLDETKIADIYKLLLYLKNKYKNVFIITHKNEIKDAVDHIISVSKTKEGIKNLEMAENPDAGISYFSMS